MGSTVGRVLRPFFKNKEVRVLIIGLDAAGKTTMLYRLKLGEVVTTMPTIGFNVETVEYKSINFTSWDVGGRGKIRPLYRHYYQNTDALIYVVDSNDRDRIEDARDELHRTLAEDELSDAFLLVMANKQDLPNALSTWEITEKLGLSSLRNRTWFITGTCAVKGDGLYEGLDWLSSQIRGDEAKKRLVQPLQKTAKEVIETTSRLSAVVSWLKSSTKSWWTGSKHLGTQLTAAA